MTHGCLRVIANRRSMMLHTYHTGQDIPLLLPLVFDVVAKYYAYLKRDTIVSDVVAKYHAYLKRDTIEGVLRGMLRQNATERLEHAHSAAALLIAAKPCFLEPVSPGVRRDLPSWSGIDSPYVLRIGGGRWRLFGQIGALLDDYDYAREIAARILLLPDEEG